MKATVFLNLGSNMKYHPELNRPFLLNHIKKTLLAPVRLNLRALVALKNLVIFSHETTSLPFIFSRGWLLIISAQNNLCWPQKGVWCLPSCSSHSLEFTSVLSLHFLPQKMQYSMALFLSF